VLIVSYALLQQDAAALCAVEFHTAVLDEAQFIKNANSLRAKAAFSLNARYRVAMTGTPVENHLGDLFSIFRFLNEGLLGSWKHFQLRYMRPIERDGESEQREALKRLIQPFLLRRTKDQVLRELPPLTTLRHEVRLSEEEALRYGLLRRQIHEKLRSVTGKREHKLRVFAEITRLRRFCCHPRLVFPEASHECSKVQTFLELVEELTENGHRALVFSQFVDFLDLVREQLDERSIPYLYLDGSTPKAARGARVAAFQAGEAPLFLVSLKAGGFGLNLTAADYVIHLDPWWNPAVEAQATDRAHRIGQERPVTVYRLVTKDTIEEQIVELHKEKRALAEALLDGTDVASRLDAEELQALLGPSPE
jgi:SNF2 family DNA or RNA helicase